MTMPAPHHSVVYRSDALPTAQPTASKHWRHSTSYHQISLTANVWWLMHWNTVDEAQMSLFSHTCPLNAPAVYVKVAPMFVTPWHHKTDSYEYPWMQLLAIMLYGMVLQVAAVLTANEKPHCRCHIVNNFGSSQIFPMYFTLGWEMLSPKVSLPLGRSGPHLIRSSLGPHAPCKLQGTMCPWFNFWFWRCIYCLLVYIICFPAYPFFFTVSLLIFSFENRPRLFQAGCCIGQPSLALVFLCCSTFLLIGEGMLLSC